MIESLISGVALFAKELLLPSLCIAFAFCVVLRMLIYYTVKRSDWFSREFEKRITKFAEKEKAVPNRSFFVTTKMTLERTFYELFEIRAIMKRRKLDYVMAPSDRIFLVQSGAAFLVKDTLKQIRFLRYGEGHPKFLEISKAVFQNNPCFNRILGIAPAAPINEMLSAMPGLFIIGGIFGTFLGIMKALPDLGGMNLNDVDGTKLVMDTFLLRISFSMATSVMGIFLSVVMTIINTFFAPERLFVDIVNRYELALEYLWRCCDNNEMPEDIANFDENRDPIEALAEYAVKQEIEKKEPKPFGSRDQAKGSQPTSPPVVSSADTPDPDQGDQAA